MALRARTLLITVVAFLALTAIAVAQPAAAQQQPPPLKFDRYPIIVTSGFSGYDAYMERIAARVEENGIYDAYVWSAPWFSDQDIEAASKAFAKRIHEIRQDYDGRLVDVVAYGGGGLVVRNFIQNLGGSGTIDSLVQLGVPNQGTLTADRAAPTRFRSCFFIPSCKDIVTSSHFINRLNLNPGEFGPVFYTNIATKQDELVVPYTNSYMPGPADHVTNMAVQDQCPSADIRNEELLISTDAYDAVEDALWKRAISITCS